MIYDYQQIKDFEIEKNAKKAPTTDSMRSYQLDLVEYNRQGLKVRYNKKIFLIPWEIIQFICTGKVQPSYGPEVVVMDIFVPDLEASLRVRYENIVYIGFPLRLYGTIHQNLELLLSYFRKKNYNLQFDSFTLSFLAQLKKESETQKASSLEDYLLQKQKKKVELKKYNSLLEYENYIWKVHKKFKAKLQKEKERKKHLGPQRYCLILKSYPPQREQEMIESLAIIQKISIEEANQKLQSPMLLLKNRKKEELEAIAKELKYLDADIRIISAQDSRQFKDLEK